MSAAPDGCKARLREVAGMKSSVPKFIFAAHAMRIAKQEPFLSNSPAIPNAHLLALYARYKFVSAGGRGPREEDGSPSLFDLRAKAKRSAWEEFSRGSPSVEQAQEEYFELACDVILKNPLRDDLVRAVNQAIAEAKAKKRR